ncbi:MAG: glycosyltransferase family 39 protein [Planctomycetota bacterium]
MSGRLLARVGLVALVLLFLSRLTHVAWDSSPTFDEPKHLSTGIVYLGHGWCCSGRDNTPLTSLNALPLYLSAEFPLLTSREMEGIVNGSLDRDLMRHRYFRARLPNLVLGALLAIVLYRFMSSRWGKVAALLGVTLLALSPTMAAYGGLVSPDFQVAVTLFLAVVAGCRLVMRGPSTGGILVTSTTVALALLAKYSAVVLLAGLPLSALLVGARSGLKGALRHLVVMLIVGVIAIGMVIAVYELPRAWHGLRGLGYFPFDPRTSGTETLLEAAAPPAGGSFGFFAGLKQVWEITRTGFLTCFMGEVGRRFTLYYPVAFLLKTPLALLIAAIAGLILWWRDRAERPCLVFPVCVLALLAGAAMQSHMCLGIRHLLPLYPWLCVMGGISLARLLRARWPIGALLVVWMAIAGFIYHPQHLAYFNELAGGPSRGHRFLADANLDWGQDYFRLRAELERRGVESCVGILHGPFPPLTYFKIPVRRLGDSEAPRGLVAVSASRLVGLGNPRAGAIVVRDFFAGREPVGRAGYSILLFEIQ